MFGSIGFSELILIFIVALLLFGPRKLPDIGRSLGRALGEFRRASNDLKRTLEEEVAADHLREVERDVRAAVSPGPTPTRSEPAAAPPQADPGPPAAGPEASAVPGAEATGEPAADATATKPTEPR